jgi:hypothetical protein
VETTARPPQRRPGFRGLWRGKLSALVPVFALVTAGIVTAPGAAHADPVFTPPGYRKGPCAELGALDLVPDDVYHQYAKIGFAYRVVSSTTVFEPAWGRFVDNDSDVVRNADWTASESRTVSLQTTFNLQVQAGRTAPTGGMQTMVTLATGVQVTESRTTEIGVSVHGPVQPHTRTLGEYGLSSMDVVMDQLLVGMMPDLTTCIYNVDNWTRGTAHIPTINEGWRFTDFPL